MQVSAIEAVKSKMVTDRNDGALDSAQFLGKSSIDIKLRTVVTRSENGKPIKDEDGDVIQGGSISRESQIEPQETVYLVSEERISVPAGHVAYVFLKNRFSQKGLLAFNTGIVDGGYSGPIATLLTNISAQSIELRKVNDGKFFRVVFHKIDMTDEEINKVRHTTYDYEGYLLFKARELLYLPRYFQNPDKIKSQIEASLNEKALNFGLLKLGLIISFAGLLMILVPPLTQLTTNIIFGTEPLNKNSWELKNDMLEKRLTEMETEIIKIKTVQSESSKLLDAEKR